MRNVRSSTLLAIFALLTSSPISATASQPTDKGDKGREFSCVVLSDDGYCLVDAREAKGNDYNWLITREDIVDFCKYRAVTRPDRKWCELLGL